jgi:altronate hydrolase
LKEFIRISPNDTVAVALRPLCAGSVITVQGQNISLLEDIPQGHKFALKDIPEGQPVIKYSAPIGIAVKTIRQGEWVHTHNMKTGLGEIKEYEYTPKPPEMIPTQEQFFQGFRRPNGTVGVRNEIWIIPTVGCVNDIASAVEKKAQALRNDSIDCIAAFRHPYGCSQMGEDQENTRKILSCLINHPNAAGVLVLGLGCENSGVEVLKTYLGDYDENRVKFLVCQESQDEISDAVALIQKLCVYAASFHREPISCKELVVGMKCGGSDGLSGITANPVVGAFSDLLISKGGTTILTEVPEMFGAETLLMDRCRDEAVFSRTVTLINDFKDYFIRHGQTIYENPSPGNKQGGISTLEDKSLGCTQKSGCAQVEDVLSYGETVKKTGLNLLSAPGNDLVASTALAASGAHLVLFTTGRGTPFACPVPTVKISSNTELAQKKPDWIDFDCGVLTQDGSIEQLGQELFDFVIQAASGKLVKSEELGFHDMAILKQGVTL